MKNSLSFTLILVAGLLSVACEEEATDACAGDFSIAASEVINASCGLPNGSISLSASGAQGTVTYRLSAGSVSGNTIDELELGTYQISAEDSQGCTASLSVTVQDEVAEITAVAEASTAECGTSEGVISLTASGGEGPYTYSLDGENFRTENEFNQLEPGQYTVTVQDANGCSTELTARVNSGISFTARVSDIISTNCAVTGCHVAGTGRTDFGVKANILDNAGSIRSRTTSGNMPPASSGRSLTDAQIADIACWVNDGAPDN
jgi:hypothetical protein